MTTGSKTTLRCVICGSNKGIERNHVCGRNHVDWFTMPFCREHHEQFHAFLRAAGVKLEYTPDSIERILRALKAVSVCEWILLETLEILNAQKVE